MQHRVARAIPKPDVRAVVEEQLKPLVRSHTDDVKQRGFTGWVGVIHRDASFDAIAQFVQVIEPGGLNDVVRILAG